jgi:hypothetical protein
MNNSGDAAEQIVRMSLEGVEFAARISGTAAKELALLIITALKNEKNKGHIKLRGKERLKSMLKSGKPLEIYSIKERDLARFSQGAKEYGIVYCVLRNTKNNPDGLCDIMVKADDAPKIARLAERFNFATVDKAKIEREIMDSRSEIPVAGQGSEPEAMDVADTEKLLDDLLGTQEGKAEPDTPEPEKAEPAQTAQNKPEPAKAETEVKDSRPLAMEGNHSPNQSAPISEPSRNSVKDSTIRPSVREEMREIRASRRGRDKEKVKRDVRTATDKTKRTSQLPVNNKSKKHKNRKEIGKMNNFDDILNNAPAQEQNGTPQLSKEDYAAMKKSERDDLFALSNDTASEVSSDGNMFRQYLDIQGRFDRYSAVNSLLILAQKPEALWLGDFDHWKNKGGSIKSNEKGISILEPQEYTKEDGSPGVGYNVKKVFDMSQVHTQRVKPDPVTPAYTERQKLQALVHKAPVPISSVDALAGSAGAQTNPDTGAITVRRGMEFSDTFSSVANELAAAEIKPNDKTRIDKDFSAYCVSYLLCKKHGVSTDKFDFKEVGKVFEYLDTQEQKAELQMIRDTFADISGRMNRQLESQQKTARNQEAR